MFQISMTLLYQLLFLLLDPVIMNVDRLLSSLLLGFIALVGFAYLLRWARRGAVHSARVDRDGGSVLVPKGVMEMFQWLVTPVGRFSAHLGFTANGVTWGSLVLGLAAGVALGLGRPGLAAFLGAFSASGDALDGWLARTTGSASPAGEVLDTTVDRCTEFFFLAGTCVVFRPYSVLLLTTVAALFASLMGSYVTAKAEALGHAAPRGAIRRTERAVLLLGGALLCPLLDDGLPSALGRPPFLPLAAAVTFLAVAGNVSWSRRMAALYRGVGEEKREGSP